MKSSLGYSYSGLQIPLELFQILSCYDHKYKYILVEFYVKETVAVKFKQNSKTKTKITTK